MLTIIQETPHHRAVRHHSAGGGSDTVQRCVAWRFYDVLIVDGQHQ